MTIVYPDAFRRSLAAGFDGVFHWDFLKQAFPYGGGRFCTPMDFDCVIERRGQFLVFETKEGEKPIPRGQVITLESAAWLGFLIIILRAKRPEDITGWDVWFRGRRGIVKISEEGAADDLVRYCRRWFDWAGRQRRSA